MLATTNFIGSGIACSGLFVVVLIKFSMFLFWFTIGFLLYNYNSKFRIYVNSTSWYEFWITTFLTFIFISFILNICISCFTYFWLDCNNFAWFDFSHHLAGENSNNSNNFSSSSSKAADAALVSTGLYAGSQIAKKIPIAKATAGKLAAVAAWTGIGLIGVASKNIISNATENVGKNKFLSITLSNENLEILKSFLGLSGNDALDILQLIQYLNIIEMYLITSIFYVLFCLFTNENTIKRLLNYLPLPVFIINHYLKLYNVIKKNGLILLIVLLLLNLTSNYLTHSYLGFFIDNIDALVKFYFN